MMKSVQTQRLAPTPGPSSSSPHVQLRRSSRPSSICSSLQTLHRLSCAPDDNSTVLSLALNSISSPAPSSVSGQPCRPPIMKKEYANTEDPLYEEIYSSSVYNSSASNNAPGHPLVTAVPNDPPRLAPVSGVLHNQDPAIIRPKALSAFKPYVRTPTDLSPAQLALPRSASAVTSNIVTSAEKVEMNSSRKASGRSLSDPWTTSGCRKPIPPQYNSPSTPASFHEFGNGANSNLGLYYPSSSDKSSSYGYGSASDQSIESLYGGNGTYYARMVQMGNEEIYDDPIHTPVTPAENSASAVEKYEMLLKEKDNEINNLRATMERNENVIFKVHEEKEACWRKQIDALKKHYETLLQQAYMDNEKLQDESSKTIETLKKQNQLLSEKAKEDEEETQNLAQKIEDLEKTNAVLESKYEEASWSICEKNGQIAWLKKTRLSDESSSQVAQLEQKLDSAQKEAFQRNLELKDLRNTLNFLTQELFSVQKKFDFATRELEHKKSEKNKLKRSSYAGGFLELYKEDSEVAKLRKELAELKFKYSAERQSMDRERSSWLAEKEKVLAYQEKLENDYLCLKSRFTIETDLDDITSEMDLTCIDEPSLLENYRESHC